MLGRELIKAILDKGMVDENIAVIGINDEGAVDDTDAVEVGEISFVEMEDGEKQAALIISAVVIP